MTDRGQHTLHIVAKELAATLNEARAALEAFAERTDQSALLERCAERLHEAHGALRVVEVYGAALLAEEMELVARYVLFIGSDRRRQVDGLDALMRAMVQLPAYLERVLSGGRDLALVLLPLLNDLRSVRGGPLLSEGTLLLLNLKSEQQPQPQAPQGEPRFTVAHWARRLRPRFQVGLLGYIRGERIAQSLEVLAQAAEKLEQEATTQAVFQLWWVAGALLEAARANGIDSSATVKRLLGQADRQIKVLYEIGEAHFCENPPVDLLNNLLYYVARATAGGDRLAAVRASFKLTELLPVDDTLEQERESLSAPSVKLMRTVAVAIKEDLSKVKDVFDIFVRRGGGRSEELIPQLELLKKISDTLGVLGLGELRQLVAQEVSELSDLVSDGSTPSEASLIKVAGVLLAVEDSLDGELLRLIVPAASTAVDNSAQDHEFRQVREAVLRECIVNLARIKEAVSLAVQKTADLPADGLNNVPQLLRGISAGLLMLGEDRAVEVMDAIGAEVRALIEPGAPAADPRRLERIAEAIVSLEYYMETLQIGRNDSWSMLDNAETCIKAVQALPAQIPSQPVVANVQPGAIDPQLIELFIEEAKEEAASIQRSFPLWVQNPMDLESLRTLRRSFHTLKGSGRMVGAGLIGEFSWSIENLLNRIIDNTLSRTPAMMILLRGAVTALPEIVEQLESGRPPLAPVSDFMSRAFAYADGRRAVAASVAKPVIIDGAAVAAVTGVTENSATAIATATIAVGEISAAVPENTAPVAEISAAVAENIAAVAENIAAVAEDTAAVPEPGRVIAETSAAVPENTAPVAEISAAVAENIAAVAEDTAAVPEPGRVIAETSAAVREDAAPVVEYSAPVPEDATLVAADSAAAPESEASFVADAAAAPEPAASFVEEAAAAPEDAALVAADSAAAPEHAASFAADAAAVPEDAALVAADSTAAPEPAASFVADAAAAAEPAASFAADAAAVPEPAASFAADAAAVPEPAASIAADTAAIPEYAAIAVEDAAAVPEDLVAVPEAAAVAEDATPAAGEREPAAEQAAAGGAESTAVAATSAADVPTMDPMLQDIYSTETSSHLAEIRGYLRTRDGRPAPHHLPESVYRAIHTLSGSSKMAEASHGIRITEPLNHVMRKIYDSGQGLTDAGIETLADAVRAIENVALHINESTAFFTDQPSIVGRLLQLEIDLEAQLARTAGDAGAGDAPTGDAGAGDAGEIAIAPPLPSPASPAPQTAGVAAQPPEPLKEPESPEPQKEPEPPEALEFDQEIAKIYCEEATELLESAEGSLAAWNVDRSARAPVAELQRELHTLKGGARMAGIAAMGDLSHELETLLIDIDTGTVRADDRAHRVMQASLDELARMRDLVSCGALPTPATALLAEIRGLALGAPQDSSSSAPVESAPPPALPPVVVSMQDPARDAALDPALDSGRDPAVLPGRESLPAERSEMARVDADLLDTMLNNAGEVSIFRARLDQQVNSIDFNLAELARTVTRLKDQLRGLEIETEAQVLHRHQGEDFRRGGFDPLELDRYSSLQQFSRALSETSGDVASIQSLLESLTREAQSMLTQQARVISELQNGLMRTRMVPFQRHVQRLTRLVRQTANDTGRRAELVVEGADAELDRQMLERMVPPLEHMLRNAVVHGIESAPRRAALGKPEIGKISVSLTRDGAEIVIVVTDDGGGIDVTLIRKNAVTLGLIDRAAQLTDDEALQLILEPGFSTAGHVTQAAGRGVGMDVVATEVKKLGGGLFIESTADQGSRFTIRLPFTLAISQALIVRVAEETYALPLATVEGVVRLPRNIVARHLGKEAPLFEHGGHKYRFQQLGSFVGLAPMRLPESDVSMPVVLIRAGEHSTALVTDELVGSREIVVKSLGPQISAIRGIAGATILGDGRVVIILDMGSLVRSEWRAKAGETAALDPRDRRTCALVVDDSITVRRVTQRLLERNGMRVLTAKDGADAVAMLQDNLPDIVLLDVEMPRMDGYEVAAHMRSDPRLRAIPIVMITSRVSEKHRARALELGVDDYLGKPYQESQLLDAIEPLVNRRTAVAR